MTRRKGYAHAVRIAIVLSLYSLLCSWFAGHVERCRAQTLAFARPQDALQIVKADGLTLVAEIARVVFAGGQGLTQLLDGLVSHVRSGRGQVRPGVMVDSIADARQSMGLRTSD